MRARGEGQQHEVEGTRSSVRGCVAGLSNFWTRVAYAGKQPTNPLEPFLV